MPSIDNFFGVKIQLALESLGFNPLHVGEWLKTGGPNLERIVNTVLDGRRATRGTEKKK